LLDQRLVGDSHYLVINIDPWMFDDHADVRGTLMAEILDHLLVAFDDIEGVRPLPGQIVQLPVTLPRLAPHDAEAYIALLLAERSLPKINRAAAHQAWSSTAPADARPVRPLCSPTSTVYPGSRTRDCFCWRHSSRKDWCLTGWPTPARSNGFLTLWRSVRHRPSPRR
jgi:hypothetical protein